MKKIILILFFLILVAQEQSYGEGPSATQNRVLYYSFCAPAICLDILNVKQIRQNGISNKVVPALGITAGIALLYIGAVENGNIFEDVQTTHICVGAVTLILSTWNLMLEPKKEIRTSWNLYTFPTNTNNMGIAFSLKRRF